jgi:hypothetical protein
MAIPEWLAARHLIATSAFVQIGSLFVRLIGPIADAPPLIINLIM